MCAVGCATCSSSNVCHSCTAAGGVAYFSHQSTCATTCPRFYFPSTATNICSPCVDECLECTSATVCTACRNKFLTAGQCQQNCPTGKYGLTSTMTCTDCPTGCLTCLNSQACSPPCAGNYAYDESAGQCTLNCPAGTYSGAFTPPAPGSSYARCLPCSINCLTCRVSPDNCTACSAGYLSTMGRAGTCSPVNVCQPGQYANTAELACQNCAGTCLTCLFSASFCISCREGMLL